MVRDSMPLPPVTGSWISNVPADPWVIRETADFKTGGVAQVSVGIPSKSTVPSKRQTNRPENIPASKKKVRRCCPRPSAIAVLYFVVSGTREESIYFPSDPKLEPLRALLVPQ